MVIGYFAVCCSFLNFYTIEKTADLQEKLVLHKKAAILRFFCHPSFSGGVYSVFTPKAICLALWHWKQECLNLQKEIFLNSFIGIEEMSIILHRQ